MDIKIEIKSKYGSTFQKRFALDVLLTILKAWQSFVLTRHKKNALEVKVNGNNIKHLDWIE